MSAPCVGCGRYDLRDGGPCYWCRRNGEDRTIPEPDRRPFSGPEDAQGLPVPEEPAVAVATEPEDPNGLVLYDFQERAVEGLRENIRGGVKNQVLCAPTGSGKTIIATYLLREAQAKGARAVFAADRKALIDQTSAVLDTYGVPHGVIQADHWRWRPWERIQVVSPQTIERRKWPPNLDLIIVDECHTTRQVTMDRIAHRDCASIGLTATPFARGMAKHWDAVVSVTTTQELIDARRLAPFRVFAPSAPDMTGAKKAGGEWTNKEAESRAIPIVGDCVREYLRHADGRKFLVFGATIAHCEELQRQFLAAGVQVALYTSRTGDAERSEILDEFRKPDSYIRGLSSVAALSKGFDVEDVSCIIMARPLRSSLSEHIQILGRGLRRDPNDPEKECLILDHAGNCVRFWSRMHAFFTEGPGELDDGKPKEASEDSEAKEVEGRKCPGCDHVHAARPTCPECGYEYPKRVIQHDDGELSELGAPVKATMEIKQEWYSQLLGFAGHRGYKEGWAAHKYRERFGVWPANTLDKRPSPPRREVYDWATSQIIRWAKSKKRGAL